MVGIGIEVKCLYESPPTWARQVGAWFVGRARGTVALMTRCVKCGIEILTDVRSCSACTWPFSLDAWPETSIQIHRITLDTGCINAKGRNKWLNTLERWAARGLLELQRSDAMLTELSGDERVAKAESIPQHPRLFVLDSSTLHEPEVLAGPDLWPELREELFPTAHPMTSNQVHDIEHLRTHIRTGGDVFVTLNPNDFIKRGRQERMRACGIWVMWPKEIVDLLHSLYGWQME